MKIIFFNVLFIILSGHKVLASACDLNSVKADLNKTCSDISTLDLDLLQKDYSFHLKNLASISCGTHILIADITYPNKVLVSPHKPWAANSDVYLGNYYEQDGSQPYRVVSDKLKTSEEVLVEKQSSNINILDLNRVTLAKKCTLASGRQLLLRSLLVQDIKSELYFSPSIITISTEIFNLPELNSLSLSKSPLSVEEIIPLVAKIISSGTIENIFEKNGISKNLIVNVSTQYDLMVEARASINRRLTSDQAHNKLVIIGTLNDIVFKAMDSSLVVTKNILKTQLQENKKKSLDENLEKKPLNPLNSIDEKKYFGFAKLDLAFVSALLALFFSIILGALKIKDMF